jgi:hypothetical protein
MCCGCQSINKPDHTNAPISAIMSSKRWQAFVNLKGNVSYFYVAGRTNFSLVVVGMVVNNTNQGKKNRGYTTLTSINKTAIARNGHDNVIRFID